MHLKISSAKWRTFGPGGWSKDKFILKTIPRHVDNLVPGVGCHDNHKYNAELVLFPYTFGDGVILIRKMYICQVEMGFTDKTEINYISLEHNKTCKEMSP